MVINNSVLIQENIGLAYASSSLEEQEVHKPDGESGVGQVWIVRFFIMVVHFIESK